MSETIDTTNEIHAINIVSVRPDNQDRVIDIMRGLGDIDDVDGLLSLHLLRSTDGTKMVNYMRWESVESLRRANQHPKVAAVIREGETLVESGDPGFYQVVLALP